MITKKFPLVLMVRNAKLPTATGVAAVLAIATLFVVGLQLGTVQAADQTTTSIGTGKEGVTDIQFSESPTMAGNVTSEFIAQQGTVSSTQDPLPGHESHQLAMILPPREDGSIYNGVLTFTASKGVEVVVLHMYGIIEEPSSEFGTVLKAPFKNGQVAITLIMPDYGDSPVASASIPFAGNALALHTLNGEPFVATYTVTAHTLQAETVNNVESAITAGNTTTSG